MILCHMGRDRWYSPRAANQPMGEQENRYTCMRGVSTLAGEVLVCMIESKNHNSKPAGNKQVMRVARRIVRESSRRIMGINSK
jgi:hypothetical protein